MKGSSHGAASTAWDGEKPSTCLGLGSTVPACWKGAVFAWSPRSFAAARPSLRPLWQPGGAHWGFGAGSGQGAVSRL